MHVMSYTMIGKTNQTSEIDYIFSTGNIFESLVKSVRAMKTWLSVTYTNENIYETKSAVTRRAHSRSETTTASSLLRVENDA